MNNTLTLIAQYLYQQENVSIAQDIIDLPNFNPTHRKYLLTKHEITERLQSDFELTTDTISELTTKLHSLIPNKSVDLSNDIRLAILTNLFLEELFIKKNSTNAISILKSVPEKTDVSIRQNLSSLLLANDSPNIFLASINWRNITNLKESRNLLVENLFKLLPNSVYLLPNTMQNLITDAHNYRQLTLPKFNSKLPDKLKHRLDYHTNEVWFIKYSPNGKFLATGSKDTKILIYNVENDYKLQCVFQLHTESITYLSWNAESTEILSLSFDQSLKVWSIELNKCIKELDNKKTIITKSRLSAAKFLPDYLTSNQILVASNDGKLFIIKLNDKDSNIPPELVSEYKKSVISPQIQDFTIQNNLIWSITINNELLVFSIPDLKLIYKMQFNSTPVAITSVSSSFPGITQNKDPMTAAFAASSSSDKLNDKNYILINLKPSSLVLINTTGISSTNSSATGNKLPYIETIFNLPVASSSHYIIRGCAGGNFNPHSGIVRNNDVQVNAIDGADQNILDTTGVVISGGSSGEIWIWGFEGNILGHVKEHEGLVNCCTWKGDGYYVGGNIEWASGSDDGTVCVWGM